MDDLKLHKGMNMLMVSVKYGLLSSHVLYSATTGMLSSQVQLILLVCSLGILTIIMF